ncbi:MAG: MBL fold metallo-hydrolase [Flavonifractor plautii]
MTTLTKQLKLPVYASPGTGRQLATALPFWRSCSALWRRGRAFPSAGWRLRASPPPTTRRRAWATPCPPGAKAAVVTDLGYVTGAVLRGIRGRISWWPRPTTTWSGCSPALPYHLKARILGDRGHLSNEAGAELAWTAVEGARTVVLAHLSHENNTPARAHEVVRGVLERRGAAVGWDVALEVAPRSEKSRRYTV